MTFMVEMREEMTAGFDKTASDLQKLDDRLQIVENKLDKALFGEVARHERWIKQIAEKVGITLT